ncbi:MAG: FAD-dependent oxidoreductase [Euryarchaeota archaeon]|nr:FAD-dependent oxidoreductase [Euryarchaeota archaeon]
MSEHHVIVGDGIAGATCAVTIRKNSDDARITVITNEEEPLYNRVKIKDFAKGKTEEQKVMMHDLDFYEKSDIELMLGTTVVKVEDERKVVVLENGSELKYDKLCYAAGGTPRRLGLQGGDAEGIHTFWKLSDARRIREHAQQSKSGVAIGAGLLGIDIAVVFALNDVDTKYVMRGNRWWREGLSKAGSEIVERGLADLGVECVFFETPKRFLTEGGKVAGLETESGKVIDCDIAGVAVGLNFNLAPVQDSNIKTGEGILTDSYLRTSVPDVWAAGDITQYFDVIQDRINMNGSWVSAKAQGEAAGLNMAGIETEFRHVDTYNINHFPFMVGSVGSIYGDQDAERKYSETEYRRLLFKQGRLNGAVLIGNIAIQAQLKKIIEAKVECYHLAEKLLEPKWKAEDVLEELGATEKAQTA